jgi:hypothetical protein
MSTVAPLKNTAAKPPPVSNSSHAGLLLQRKCACGGSALSSLTGECEGYKNKRLQTKLSIGASNDPLEQEADRVADQVLAAPANTAFRSVLPRIQRFTGQAIADAGTAPASVDRLLSGSGRPLDPAIQQDMGHRFGHDFSQVRVHTGAAAEQSALDVNANAYTAGHNIVFGAGRFAPETQEGRRLLAHELTHVVQQSGAKESYINQINKKHGQFPVIDQQQTRGKSRLTVVDSLEYERNANISTDAVYSHIPISTMKVMPPGFISRQKLQPDESPKIERNFELDPNLFIKPMNAPAEKEDEQCEEFPGGSTDCEVDKKTGTPTGKVTHRINETNQCIRPCVEQHEAIHVKQLKTFCPKLRDCYLAADKGKRPVMECIKMAVFGMNERECEAYKVSVPCVENRLKNAKECQSKENKNYGIRVLASEKCFRNKNCGS